MSKFSNYILHFYSQSELVANRMIKFWLHPHFIYKWTTGYKQFQHNAECIYKIPREVRCYFFLISFACLRPCLLLFQIRKIKEKEFYESKYFENNQELKEDEFFSTPQIFVNELFKLHNQKLLDDRMLDDQILTILVGGNETSALTTSHVILMLAMHPEIQERAFLEIKDAHETQTSHSDAEILAKLDYLEMCIKETMRLFPVGPFLGRQNVEDVELSM